MVADPNAPLTRRVLEEVIDDRVPKIIDDRVPKIIDDRVPKIIDDRVPNLFGEFTEQVLLPAIQQIVQKEIAGSEHRMKAWVDEKLADLRGDIVLLTRKEDRKVLKIVDILREKKILNDSEVQEILRMEPFAAQ